MKNILLGLIVIYSLVLTSCKKSDFLAEKPSTEITQPKTLSDFQQLLDNTVVNNFTGSLAQISADDYEVPFTGYQTVTETERNAYIWAKDLYGSDVSISAWSTLYKEIFYANVVLEGLEKSDSLNTAKGQNLKGWALFSRAYYFYDLTRTFCKAYHAGAANSDLGIPLKLSSRIDELLPRSSLQQSFDQILNDLNQSAALLPEDRPQANLNRPSKIAAYALLARIYLDSRDYTQAEKYADNCLNSYHNLIDYNSVNQTSSTPFSMTNDELIFNTSLLGGYLFATSSSISPVRISPALINMYSPNDLRLKLYFSQLPDGSWYKKRGYNGLGAYGFTGLATDEIYLIKAECLSRRNETAQAMDKLNELLIRRYTNKSPYIPLTASSAAEALSKILLERRKELVWRGLRWYDLKRLNIEGSGITLTRVLNGITYSLPPNDPRYIFPIPNDEITYSGLQQNIR